MGLGLLGYWPGECEAPSASASTTMAREAVAIVEEDSNSTSASTSPRSSKTSSSEWPPLSGITDDSEDVFFDAPEPRRKSAARPSVARAESFKPSSKSPTIPGEDLLPAINIDEKTVDWRQFPAPQELLKLPPGTAMEIDSILEASVERLQDRLVEEDRVREEKLQEELKAKYASQDGDTFLTPAISAAAKGKKPMALPQGRAQKAPAGALPDSPFKPEDPSSFDAFNSGLLRPSPTSSGAGSSGMSGVTPSTFKESSYVTFVPAPPSPEKSRFGPRSIFGTLFRRGKNASISGEASASSASLPPTIKECVSCLEDFDSRILIPLSCHSYCKTCFGQLIDTAMSSEDQWPPKCCLNEIPPAAILPHLPAKSQKRYKSLAEERLVPTGERIYCSKPSCAAWIPPRNINKSASLASCASCRHKSCTSCRGAHHGSVDCPDDPNLLATMNLASAEGWRRCYSCSALVEHNQGCIHMTCKCKAQFCYICGLRWHTCSCTDAALADIRARADTRRNATQLAEAAAAERARAEEERVRMEEEDAADLAEALAMIENFEIEEMRRRAEEEEEMRLAAEASRRQREEEITRAIEQRYKTLEDELDFVHSLQRVAMLSRYEAEARIAKTRELAKRKEVKTRQDAHAALLETQMKTEIADRTFAFEQKYAATLEREREILDGYVRQLEEYYAESADKDAQVAALADVLKGRQAEDYTVWDSSRKRELDVLGREWEQRITDVRRSHQEELDTFDAGYVVEMSEKARARVADSVWLEKVTPLRLEMLQEMVVMQFRDEDGWEEGSWRGSGGSF